LIEKEIKPPSALCVTPTTGGGRFPVALHVESEGRAAALADGALWAVFDALTACGALSGDTGDAALSLVRPCRTVHSLYGM
jgi:hypothetical protein